MYLQNNLINLGMYKLNSVIISRVLKILASQFMYQKLYDKIFYINRFFEYKSLLSDLSPIITFVKCLPIIEIFMFLIIFQIISYPDIYRTDLETLVIYNNAMQSYIYDKKYAITNSPTHCTGPLRW